MIRQGTTRTLYATVMSMLVTAVWLVVPTAARAAPGGAGERCVIIAQPVQPGMTVSPLSRVCGDSATLKAATAARSWLARIYEDANFQGDETDVYGDYGTCDREGYNIDISANGWGLLISSYRIYGACYWSYYYDWPYMNASYGHIGDVAYVGDPWNDWISIIHIWSR